MDDGTMDVDQRRFGRLVSRHSALIVLCVLLGVILAFALAALQGTSYTATTQLRVASPLTLADVIGTGTSSSSTRTAVTVSDQIAVLQSDPVKAQARTILGGRSGYTTSFSAAANGNVVSVTATAADRQLAHDAAAAYTQAYLTLLAQQNQPLFQAAVRQLNANIASVNDQANVLSKTLASASSSTLESVRAQVGDSQSELLTRRTQLQTQLDSVQLEQSVAPSGDAAVVSAPSTAKVGGLLRTLLLGAIVGLLIGLLLAGLRESHSGRILTAADVQDIGLPLAADVPVALPRRTRTAAAALAKGDDLAAYRAVAVALAPPHSTTVPRRWLVTAPDATGVSASVLAGRVARQLASLGRLVALIDCDPSSGEGATGVNPSAGLAEVLRCEVPIAQGLTHDIESNVYVMSAGRDLASIGEPLASPTFASLLDTLSERFGIVIITGTPLGRSADADVVVPLADLVVLALERGVTRRRAVTTAAARLGGVLGDARLETVLVGSRHSWSSSVRPPSGGKREQDPALARQQASSSVRGFERAPLLGRS